MTNQAVFAGLIFDEFDRPVEVAYVGDEPCYVVDDAVDLYRAQPAGRAVHRRLLKPPYEIDGAIGTGDNRLDLQEQVRVFHLLRQEVCRDENGRQDVVQVVADAGRKLGR